MSLLEAAVGVLRERGTAFALIGAAAMAVHGVSRATRDLDLLVLDHACLDAAYWEPLRRGGADVQVRCGDPDDPLAGVVRLRRAAESPLDPVVGKSAWQTGVLSRASHTIVESVSVPVAGRADLILLKLYAAGHQDAWDVEQLLGGHDRGPTVAEVDGRLPSALGAYPWTDGRGRTGRGRR